MRKFGAKGLAYIQAREGELRYYTFPNGNGLLAQSEDISEIGAVITDLEMPVVSGFEVSDSNKWHNH